MVLSENNHSLLKTLRDFIFEKSVEKCKKTNGKNLNALTSYPASLNES